MKLADVSVRRPVFAAMLIAALIVFGLMSYPKIGVDLFPNVDYPVITVTVVYPGADPETMESKVAEPIEEAIQSLSGIDKLTSQNMESVTQVIVQFELDVSADDALQDIREKVAAVESNLPSGIDPPLVQKFDIGAAPILSVAVAGPLHPADLTALAEDVVKQQLERIPGVGGIDLIGARDREIEILVDPTRLAMFGLTIQDVAATVGAQSLDLPAGYTTQGSQELTVKTKGEVRDVAEIAGLIIPAGPGSTVRISDVAEIVDGLADARSASSLDGSSAIALVVRKQSGANTVEVARRVREAIDELQPQIDAAGAVISVPTDNSVYIEHAIGDLQFDLLLGAGLTVLIIFVFLNDGRATLISALALPTSVIGTFLAMQLAGFSFNNLTMLALSLSIGILVDDAIVVIENIHRHLEMGKSKRQAALDGTSEIGMAVLATTLSIVAVFVPVAIMEGLIGRFFFQFGITVAVAVMLSMFVSFSLTPLLASRILRSTPHGARKPWMARAVDWLMGGLSHGYARVLGWSLRKPALTLLVAFLAFAGAMALLTQMKFEFTPPEDRAQFAVNVEAPTGTSLHATQGVVEAVAADIRQNLPEVKTTFTTVGDARGSQTNKGRIEVVLTGSKERSWRQQQGMAWVRERFASTDEVEITVEEISAVGGGGQSAAPIQFVLKGNDIDELAAAAEAIKKRLLDVPGLVDIDTSNAGGKPEITIEIDRDRAADLGVPVAAVAQALRALVAGDPVGELRSPGGTADITVAMPKALRSRIESLANLQVRSSAGQLIDLSNIVTVHRGEGPSVISRLDRQRQVTVFANLDGLPLGEAQQLVQAVAAQEASASISTSFVGMVEIMQESFGHMVVALGLAVLIVYMILAAQFNSFTQPIAIMLSLPLSFVGAFGALYLFGMTLNIFSMIGLIMLMGLVTKNAILLVDFANSARSHGKPIAEALVEAGRVRLRPILMTTAAMIFGMLPVAMAISEGGETRAPMAMAVIGGLMTSTLLTLLVVPVVYQIFDRMVNSRLVLWMLRVVGLESDESEGTPGPETTAPASKETTQVTQPSVG